MPKKLSAKLTVMAVLDIKKMIWDGYSQKEAAIEYGVTQSYVSLIVQGNAYHEVEWPDGSIGPIDQTHYRSLRTNSKKQVVHTLTSFDEPHVMHKLDVLQKADDTKTIIKDAELVEKKEARAAEMAERRDNRERMMDNIQKAGEELEEELSITLKDSIKEPGEESSKKRKITSTKYEMIPWSVIEEKAGDLPLVQLAEEREDIQKAIQIAFFMTSKEMWKEDSTTELVGQIAKHLREEEIR